MYRFELNVTGTEPCQQMDPELFFEESNYGAAVLAPLLKRVCEGCPILFECREHAVAHEEFGFWGGMSARERKIERRRRGITLESVAVWNNRTHRERLELVKEREKDDMQRLPKRSDFKWRVAEGGSGGAATA